MSKMLIFRNGNGMKFSEVVFEGSLDQCKKKMLGIYNNLIPAPYAASIREACAYSRRNVFAVLGGMSEGGHTYTFSGALAV